MPLAGPQSLKRLEKAPKQLSRESGAVGKGDRGGAQRQPKRVVPRATAAVARAGDHGTVATAAVATVASAGDGASVDGFSHSTCMNISYIV